MKNFFSKFFNKQEVIEEKEVDKVVSACISLMIEVSLADQSIDESEIESLKKHSPTNLILKRHKYLL